MSDWFDEPVQEEVELEAPKKENFFFKFLEDISYEKEFLLNDDNQSQYSPYMVNRFLSNDLSTLMYAQEMNIRPGIDKDMHYEYLMNAVRKKKRFFKYAKATKDEVVTLLAEYYEYNARKAKEVASLHSEDDLASIASKLNVGGANAKKKRNKARSR